MPEQVQNQVTPPAANAGATQAANPSAPNVNVVVQNQQPVIQATLKTMDKNVFTWVFCFLLGGFGVDRFVRGQVGTGIAKLLLGWATLGIWPLVDWIIALTKAYGSAFKNDKDFTFVNGKYAR